MVLFLTTFSIPFEHQIFFFVGGIEGETCVSEGGKNLKICQWLIFVIFSSDGGMRKSFQLGENAPMPPSAAIVLSHTEICHQNRPIPNFDIKLFLCSDIKTKRNQ